MPLTRGYRILLAHLGLSFFGVFLEGAFPLKLTRFKFFKLSIHIGKSVFCSLEIRCSLSSLSLKPFMLTLELCSVRSSRDNAERIP
jgi:hypothetical protein